MYDIKHLGQVFTPRFIVEKMLGLRKNFGSVLEPSSGIGAFSDNIPNCVSIEIDPKHCSKNSLNIDFFDYSTDNKFDTIIGNPPYVRYQDITQNTKNRLNSDLFDERTNLYLFFIEKCIKHLSNNGELIFITPRDFLKATSAAKLNKFIFESGTITDLTDLGDKKIFDGASPNCIIWRFEKNSFLRKTNTTQEFMLCNGQLLFANSHYSVRFSDIFSVKVGAVSGNDKIFANSEFANEEFVCSQTRVSGKTRKMIFNIKNQFLEQHKSELLQRKIRKFNETNWWQWGRLHHISDKKRIYVNCKTRVANPFFTHKCKNYDGSVLAIFPKNQNANEKYLCEKLNSVNWDELGFVCDGRYIFSQKSLENSLLPEFFRGEIRQRYSVKMR